jgi:hypothetical protein
VERLPSRRQRVVARIDAVPAQRPLTNRRCAAADTTDESSIRSLVTGSPGRKAPVPVMKASRRPSIIAPAYPVTRRKESGPLRPKPLHRDSNG